MPPLVGHPTWVPGSRPCRRGGQTRGLPLRDTSEMQLQSKLNLPSVLTGGIHQSEIRVINKALRRSEGRLVQKVEKLSFGRVVYSCRCSPKSAWMSQCTICFLSRQYIISVLRCLYHSCGGIRVVQMEPLILIRDGCLSAIPLTSLQAMSSAGTKTEWAPRF